MTRTTTTTTPTAPAPATATATLRLQNRKQNNYIPDFCELPSGDTDGVAALGVALDAAQKGLAWQLALQALGTRLEADGIETVGSGSFGRLSQCRVGHDLRKHIHGIESRGDKRERGLDAT